VYQVIVEGGRWLRPSPTPPQLRPPAGKKVCLFYNLEGAQNFFNATGYNGG